VEPAIPGALLKVTPDGKNVYLPNEDFDARVAAGVEKANQPSPEQINVQRNRQMMDGFVQSHPDMESRQAAIEMTQSVGAVDDFMRAKLEVLLTQGYKPTTMEEVKYVMRESGAHAEVEKSYPEMAQYLDEMLDAWGAQQPGWTRSIMDRMMAESRQEDVLPDNAEIMPTKEPKLKNVKKMPKSLARKSGSRSQSESTLENEFDKLEAKYGNDPLAAMEHPKEMDKYISLGRQLNKDGFDGI